MRFGKSLIEINLSSILHNSMLNTIHYTPLKFQNTQEIITVCFGIKMLRYLSFIHENGLIRRHKGTSDLAFSSANTSHVNKAGRLMVGALLIIWATVTGASAHHMRSTCMCINKSHAPSPSERFILFARLFCCGD